MCDFQNLDYGQVREMFDAEIELDIDDAIVETKENLKLRIKEALKALAYEEVAGNNTSYGYREGKKEALETVLSWL